METKMSEDQKHAPILIDLGKQKRGRVKRLRKGRGRLVDDVQQAIADLAANGSLSEGVQPVIVVVERKKKRGFKGMF